MATGWIELDGKSYYLDPSTGAMYANTRTPDNFWVDVRRMDSRNVADSRNVTDRVFTGKRYVPLGKVHLSDKLYKQGAGTLKQRCLLLINLLNVCIP